MNKNEMNKIEKMAKVMCGRTIKCKECVFGNYVNCMYKEEAIGLYNADYRKVGDDEIVVKKSELEALKKAKNIIQLDISEEFLKECEHEMQELRQKERQETAREILQEVYDTFAKKVENGLPNRLYDDFTSQVVKIIANRHGIELE